MLQDNNASPTLSTQGIILYPIYIFVSYSNLSHHHKRSNLKLSSISEATLYYTAILDPNWKRDIDNELKSLINNHT